VKFETKPIRPAGSGGTGPGNGDMGTIIQNKPNSRAEPLPLAPRPASLTPGGSDYAKQSQTWANWSIWGTGRRGRTQDKCAKQTQFGPRQSKGQVVCRKGFMVNRTGNRLRKNKANLRARPRTGVGRGVTGGAVAQAYCAKQSQCFDCGLGADRRRDAYRATCCAEHVVQTKNKPNLSLGGRGRYRGQSCQTNPIPGRCRATGALYKQTQFPGGTRPGGRARGCDCAKQTQFEDGPKEG
jgi:hypothetical protein